MIRRTLAIAAAAVSMTAIAEPALAQQNEQFIPLLVYRTGAYAVNGVPYANGVVDYYNLVNERDGGVNGVKLTFEECETGLRHRQGRGMLRAPQGQRPHRRFVREPAVRPASRSP